jgi:hypothetical protein
VENKRWQDFSSVPAHQVRRENAFRARELFREAIKLDPKLPEATMVCDATPIHRQKEPASARESSVRWLARLARKWSILSVIPAVAHCSPLPVLPKSDDWSVMVPTIRAMIPKGNATRVCLVASSMLLSVFQPCSLEAQEGPAGITSPAMLSPFDPNAPACSRPSGLERVLAFSQDNDRKFMQGVAHGLALAAKDRGLEYRVAQANNDPAKMVDQVRAFLDAKVGALVVAPVDPPSIGPVLKQVIWSGAYVGAIVPPPATTVLNAPQYLTVGRISFLAGSMVSRQR